MQQVSSSAVDAVPPGPTVVYISVPIRSRTYDCYRHKQSIGLGTVQIIIGSLCIILNCIGLGMVAHGYVDNEPGFVGHGFTCGILYIITGSFGVGAGIKKTKFPIMSFMIMGIVSAVVTPFVVAIGIIEAVIAAQNDGCYNSPSCENQSSYDLVLALGATMATLGYIGALIAVWGSVLCGVTGVCYCSDSTPSSSQIAPQPDFIPNGSHMSYKDQSQKGQLPNSEETLTPSYATNNQKHGWTMASPNSINEPQNGQIPDVAVVSGDPRGSTSAD